MSITIDGQFDDEVITRSAVACDATGCDESLYLPFDVATATLRITHLGWQVRNAFWASQTVWCPAHASRQEIGL